MVAQRFVYPQGYNELYIDDAERKTLQDHLAELLAAGKVRRDGARFALVAR